MVGLQDLSTFFPLKIHWPVPLEIRGDEKIPLRADGTRAIDADRKIGETWAEMEKVQANGKAKAIGLSNFSRAFVEELLKTAKVTPAANQIELHPYLPQHDLVNFCNEKGIICEAYSPLGSTNSPMLKDDVLTGIAKAKGVDVGQLIISWQAQRGVAVLPKSVTPSRIISNGKLIELSDDEMKTINELHRQEGKHQRLIKPAVRIDGKKLGIICCCSHTLSFFSFCSGESTSNLIFGPLPEQVLLNRHAI